jgi:cell volume regulation protein A
MPPPARPDPLLLGDFFVTGEHTLGELADIYGLTVAQEDKGTTLADHFARHGRRMPRPGDVLPFGEIALVAHQVTEGRVVSVGLRLAEVEPDEKPPSWRRRLKQAWRKLLARLG